MCLYPAIQYTLQDIEKICHFLHFGRCNLKWLHETDTSAKMSLKNCFVMAHDAIPSDEIITIALSTTTTSSASTHTLFDTHPQHVQCSYFVRLNSNYFPLSRCPSPKSIIFFSTLLKGLLKLLFK